MVGDYPSVKGAQMFAVAEETVFDFPMTPIQAARLWRHYLVMPTRDSSDEEMFRLLNTVLADHPDWLDLAE